MREKNVQDRQSSVGQFGDFMRSFHPWYQRCCFAILHCHILPYLAIYCHILPYCISRCVAKLYILHLERRSKPGRSRFWRRQSDRVSHVQVCIQCICTMYCIQCISCMRVVSIYAYNVSASCLRLMSIKYKLMFFTIYLYFHLYLYFYSLTPGSIWTPNEMWIDQTCLLVFTFTFVFAFVFSSVFVFLQSDPRINLETKRIENWPNRAGWRAADSDLHPVSAREYKMQCSL